MPSVLSRQDSSEHLLALQDAPPSTCLERLFTPRVVLALFTLVNFFTYFDRGAISALLTDIRSDSTIAGDHGIISEAKGGFIVSAFMIGFMITCPLFASLGGRFSAKQIIVFGLIVWAVACVMTACSISYAMILLSRMFVGVGEAAYAGFTVTIIDNIAPKAARTMWIGCFYSMIPVGTAIGMAVSGAMGTEANLGRIPGWRVVFVGEVLVTVPVILGVVLLPSKYNPRSGKESESIVAEVDTDGSPAWSDSGSPGGGGGGAIYAEGTPSEGSPVAGEEPTATGNQAYLSLPSAVKLLLKNANYMLVVFGYGMYVFVTGALAVWAISMLVQGPLRLTTIQSSSIVGGAVALTGLLGSVVGGIFVDRMGGSQGKGGLLKCQYFNIAMMLLSIPFGLVAMFARVLWLFIIFFILSVFALFSVTAPVNASILTSVEPRMRTYAVSFSILGIHAMGDFPSPALTGFISDKFSNGCPEHKDRLMCEANPAQECVWITPPEHSLSNPYCANAHQLRNALCIVYGFLFLAVPAWGIVALRVRRALKREEADAAAAAGLNRGTNSITGYGNVALNADEESLCSDVPIRKSA